LVLSYKTDGSFSLSIVAIKFHVNQTAFELSQTSRSSLGCPFFFLSFWFRLIHMVVGIPKALLNQMFGNDRDVPEEGISLLIRRKLVKLMNGDVQYLKEVRCCP
ncbi:hypothetical protein PanWU01x14_179790, partial [Parasponia andersonii]